MTSLVDRRESSAVTAATGALFALACFFVGAFAVRQPIRGWMLVAALASLVIYMARPQWMAWLALFLAFASLPGLPIGNGMWPMSAYTYHVALVLAIAFLAPRARLRFADLVLPGVFLLTVACFAVAGLAAGNSTEWVNREALFLFELVAGFVLAMVIVRAGCLREAMWAMGVIVWFSAAMILASSLTGLQLVGRASSLEGETGSAQAIRLITYTETPALAVLAALVAAQIVGRGRLSVHLALGLPALLITLLSFARDALIVVGVTAAAALLATLGWFAIRRLAVLAALGAAVIGVVLPAVLFLMHNSEAGSWLSDQLNAFSYRVIGGVSPTAMAVDSSTQDRLRENAHLMTAFADAPFFGHGLGFAYQLPFGKAGSFTATLGTTYSHNFYFWWLVKSGAVGMASFAAFALTPVVRGLRGASASAKISAAVGAGLLAASAVSPMPLEPAQSLTLGLALGAAMGLARSRQETRRYEPTNVASAPTAHYV